MFERNNLAVANANKLIEKYCIKTPNQYSLEEILNAEGLFYTEEKLDGLAGNVVFSVNSGIITVNSNLETEAQKIFTAAHELGHFENERVTFKACAFEDILGIKRSSPTETAANDFASELLMHKPWFVEFTENKKFNTKLLSECAEYFSVSLSAAAFRYAEIGYTPSSIIMSTNGIVRWSSISKYFPYNFIRNGTKVHNMSYAFDIHSAIQKYSLRKYTYEEMKHKFAEVPVEDDIPAYAWFNEDFFLNGNKNIRIMETNVAMPSYNSVLTILWEV